jgi:hypothetical protein
LPLAFCFLWSPAQKSKNRLHLRLFPLKHFWQRELFGCFAKKRTIFMPKPFFQEKQSIGE